MKSLRFFQKAFKKNFRVGRVPGTGVEQIKIPLFIAFQAKEMRGSDLSYFFMNDKIAVTEKGKINDIFLSEKINLKGGIADTNTHQPDSFPWDGRA